MSSNIMEWIGHSKTFEDLLRPEPARFMQTALDQDPTLQENDLLPPLWHWLYFLESKKATILGRDGHPEKGEFLPPVSLPRRMWAGGRFQFHFPLILGKKAKKKSIIKSITEKIGRSGRLCFVTVRHDIFQAERLALSEEHDIVYREDPLPGSAKPDSVVAPKLAEFSEIIRPSEVLLFRYSALTFNGHRIHYDVDYARDVEGYEGLVFHGPLTATFLVNLASRQAGAQLEQFNFRGVSPISGMSSFFIEGRSQDGVIKLWARRDDGSLAMSAEAIIRN
jgi:3-methylfumaryl-CoA hydratase